MSRLLWWARSRGESRMFHGLAVKTAKVSLCGLRKVPGDLGKIEMGRPRAPALACMLCTRQANVINPPGPRIHFDMDEILAGLPPTMKER